MLVNKLKELRNGGDEEGFTLIELMIVVVIIGILAAIAIPIFANQQKEAAKASIKSDVKNTVTAVATYLVSNPTAATLTDAVIDETETGTNVVTISGSWDAYVVSGSNTSVSGFTYTFTSSTGVYA